jgi:hypothetical protein
VSLVWQGDSLSYQEKKYIAIGFVLLINDDDNFYFVSSHVG